MGLGFGSAKRKIRRAGRKFEREARRVGRQFDEEVLVKIDEDTEFAGGQELRTGQDKRHKERVAANIAAEEKAGVASQKLKLRRKRGFRQTLLGGSSLLGGQVSRPSLIAG